MAEEVKNQEQKQQGDNNKKNSFFNKLVKKIEEDDKRWEEEGISKGLTGRNLDSKERKEIENAAIAFIDGPGKDENVLNDVSSWVNDDNGKKLVSHFEKDGKDAVLLDTCDAYKKCAAAYQSVKGNSEYNYDENAVAWDRLQTSYDIAFYVVLSGLPRFLISNKNQHTMGYVMSRFKEGKGVFEIQSEVQKKLGTNTTAKKETKKGDDPQQKSENNGEEKDSTEEKAVIGVVVEKKNDANQSEQNNTAEQTSKSSEGTQEMTPEEKKSRKRFLFSAANAIEEFGARIADEKLERYVAIIKANQMASGENVNENNGNALGEE